MKKYLFVLIILHGICINTFSQSGWIREKKDYFLKLDYTFYNATDYHNLQGDVLKTSSFSQKTIAIYTEYGLSNRFAFNVFLPILRQNSYQNSEAATGIGDLKLEIKYALLKGSFPVAVSLAPEFPIGSRELVVKNKNNPQELINLPTGDGEFNIWSTAAISHSFYPVNLYTSLYGSVNWRTTYKNRNFQNQFQTGAEIGYKIKNKIWINSKLLVLSGIGKSPQFADFIRGDGTTYTATTLGGLYEIGKHWGISTQYFRCNSLIEKARNNYAANIYSLGFIYNKKR